MAAAVLLATGAPAAADEAPRSAAASNACGAGCFILTSVLIEGVTAYPVAALAETYDHNLARQVRVDDLVQSATAITDKYRRDGYFLTRAVVAENDGEEGAARIVVYEGYIAEVRIDGAGAAAAAPFLKPLEGRRPLTIGELDRRLALASGIPGMTLTSRIEPIVGDPARHRLVVETRMDRADAGLYAENRGTETQGPWQVYVTAGANSIFAPGDRVSGSALTVPDRPDELTWAEAAYSIGVPGGGRLRVAAAGYATDAPAGAGNGWVGGHSRSVSVNLAQPLVRSRDRNLWLNAGLDVQQVDQVYAAAGRSRETLAVARVSLAGQVKSPSGYVSGSLQVSHGVDAFGATTDTSPAHTRPDATGRFTKANLRMAAYHDVGRYAGVYGEVAAQWSKDPLLGSEEFLVGGPTFGRAYNYGEIGGDKAAAAMIEARAGWSPAKGAVTFVQGYAFADSARVWNKTPTGDRSDRRASAGVGSRITFNRDTTLRVEFAKPLSGRPYAEKDDGWRTFVSLSRQF